MKALVTGGAGFIGSNLVDRLLDDGWKVRVMDNMSAGSRRNLAHRKGEPRLELHVADIRNAGTTSRLVKGCDAVFHLAAHADLRASLKDHKADLNINVVGTLNVLEAMLRWKVEDLVFASTSALYGVAEHRPTPEDYAPTQTSIYGASKIACEAFAEAYSELGDFRFWAFRFSNVVGERCRRGVIWDFVHKLTANPRELEILGDGNQRKEYIHVEDCVNGVMTGYQEGKKKVNTFNIAVEDDKTVDEVADIVVREMGLQSVRRRYTGGIKGWIGDNPVVQLSVERLKSMGWQPRHKTDDAIAETTRWTKEEIQRR